MRSFLYPAIFYKDEDEYRVLFPDIELATKGEIVEEAFLYAKDFLEQYFIQVLKYDLDYNLPSDFEEVRKKCKKDDVLMLIQADVRDKEWK